MADVKWPNKDPDERLDYVLDWTARLGDDSITISAFTVISGDVEIDDQEIVTGSKKTLVWLQGGTVDPETQERECRILNRITTAAGRIMDQTARIKLKAK